MSKLSARSTDLLQTYLKKCKRSHDAFVFGPAKRGEFDSLKQILDELKIGYFGSYATEKTDKGGLPEYVFMHVLHNQARKLSEVLISLHIREEIDFLKAQEANKKDDEDDFVFASTPPPVSDQPAQPAKSANRWKALVKAKS